MSVRSIPVEFYKSDFATTVQKSRSQRLRKFVSSKDSEAIKLFSPAERESNFAGDWYGEHLGKWLFSVSKALQSTHDQDLVNQVLQVIELLEKYQEPSGYLGTYSPLAPSRFTHGNAFENRTWDLWVHAWLMDGLIEASQIESVGGRAIAIAERIGNLILDTFNDSPGRILQQGNHLGLSSLVVLEPIALLARATNRQDFADFASRLLVATRETPLKGLLDSDSKTDISQIGTGKSYQMLWCLKGMLDLYELTNQGEILESVKNIWQLIVENHLTPQGGPWGGIATHKEVFNHRGYFNPNGLVETCSSVSWLSLTQKLYTVTGDPCYLPEIEKTLFNSILGAADENGSDWIYFSFPNGRRNNTYHWACCKSSGAMGLELAHSSAVYLQDETVCIGLWHSFRFTTNGYEVEARLEDGQFVLKSSDPMTLKLFVPQWAKFTDPLFIPGRFVEVQVCNEPLIIEFERILKVTPFRYILDHHGQEIVRDDYLWISLGPYVFATTKIEGYRTEETLRIPELNPLSVISRSGENEVVLKQPGREPITFTPFYLTGGRHDGAYRMTWIPVAWQ